MSKKSGKVFFNPFDVVEDSSISLNDLSPQLRIVFKRLLKKDISTRLSGLGELSTWLSSCSEEQFLPIRTHFVKIYRSSVGDPERRVRELANQCLYEIVKREKRWLSPCLKELFYPWLGSLLDSVSAVSSKAQQVFDTCFGHSRTQEVCRLASSTIFDEAWKVISSEVDLSNPESKLLRSFELSIAFNSTCFILSNLKSDNDGDVNLIKGTLFFKNIIGSSCNVMRDFVDILVVKTALYRLLTIIIRRGLLECHQITLITDEALNDIDGSLALQALQFLSVIQMNDFQLERLNSKLKSTLANEIPKAAIPQLQTLWNNLNTIQVKLEFTKSIWSTIISYKSLDTSRLLLIWDFFTVCLKQLPLDQRETLFKVVLERAFSVEEPFKALQHDMLQTLVPMDSRIFIEKFKEKVYSNSLDCSLLIGIALNLPNHPQINSLDLEITKIFQNLDCKEQEKVIGRILEMSKVCPFSQLLLNNYFFQGASSSLDSQNSSPTDWIERLSRLSPDKNPNLEIALDAIIKMLPSLSLKDRLSTSGALLSGKVPEGKVPLIDDKIGLAACESFGPINAMVLLKGIEDFCKIPCSSFLQQALKDNEENWLKLEPLLPLADLAFKKSLEWGKVFVLAVALVLDQNIISPMLMDESTISFLFRNFKIIDPTLSISLLQKLLTLNPKLWRMALKEITQENLLELIESHLSCTMALCSYPLCLVDESIERKCWDADDMLVEEVKILFTIMSFATKDFESEPWEIIIKVAAFSLTLKEESKYTESSNNQTLITFGKGFLEAVQTLFSSLTKDGGNFEFFGESQGISNTLKSLIKSQGGMFWILAKELGMTTVRVSEYLNFSAPLEMSYLVCIEDSFSFSLPIDLNSSLALKLMAIDHEWSRDVIFQLLATAQPCLNSSLVDRAIIFRFLATFLSRDDIKAEYWNNNHIDLIIRVIDYTITEIFHDDSSILKQNVLAKAGLRIIILALGIESLCQIVTSRIKSLWSGFLLISKLQTLPVHIQTVENASRAFSILTLEIGSFTDADDICQLLLSSTWTLVKLTCRNMLMKTLDEHLERARVTLGKIKRDTIQEEETYEALRESLLVPWPSLKNVLLETKEERSIVIDELLALDIFLCLAEGAREEQNLSGAYASYFRESLSNRYLSMLSNILGWFSNANLDLSRVEFTILDFEVTAIDCELFAANLLFRCLKVFPSTVRSWYGNLAKETSTKFLKNCTLYMTPLLIERELQRIRKASKGQLIMRVVRTSTNCSILVKYNLEEFSFSLDLDIPPEYPLRAVSVTGGERLGISESKWRSWLLSVQTLLNQNLALIEVIQQWQANAQRTLEGVEPCSICYCVLQPGDRSLPGPCCKTCRNKFHSACLYRWFKTGGQATCPMCRSLF